jgi:hypothetical protein
MDGLISTFFVDFFEWIDDMRLSPTSTLEDDDQYEDMRRNFEVEHHARRRHRGEDLI